MALQFTFNYPVNPSRNRTLPLHIFGSPQRSSVPRLMGTANSAAISWKGEASYDPELRYVLELATGSELYDIHRILFGPSYFSPLLKSVITGGDAGEFLMIEEDLEERENFISALESRFLFLAADARATLRCSLLEKTADGSPGSRNFSSSVATMLEGFAVCCVFKSGKEVDLDDLDNWPIKHHYSEESGIFPGLWENSKVKDNQNSLELGVSSWKAQSLPATKGGYSELFLMILKGSGVFTLTNVYQLLAKKFTKKLFIEAANYQIKKEALKKSGQLAAINLESRAALLVAKQGLAGAASRYLGLKSMMGLLGPMLWGTFLADIVIQMLGTDYARVIRAIYAFAQMDKELGVMSARLDLSAGIQSFRMVDRLL